MKLTDNIIELNRDMEPYVLQAAVPRSQHNFKKLFGDKAVPLSFVHLSDIHAAKAEWNRMVEYVNHYSDCISFVLHTGDYCGGSQKSYVNFYQDGDPCVRPIYNCVGNHDCYSGEGPWSLAEKSSVHRLLFPNADTWDVSFMDCEYSMSYFKDFPESNIRLIVLDLYYHIWETRVWLKGLLEDAREKGLHVVTAMHERTGYIETHLGDTYSSLDPYRAAKEEYELARTAYDFDHRGRVLFEDILADFIKKGGNYVCNLVGHEHHDEFGTTARGILNVVVQNGTTWDKHGDMRRYPGTKSQDCFNVVAIDTDLGLLKIIRIGANVDHFLRKKGALCFDYINKKIIAES